MENAIRGSRIVYWIAFNSLHPPTSIRKKNFSEQFKDVSFDSAIFSFDWVHPNASRIETTNCPSSQLTTGLAAYNSDFRRGVPRGKPSSEEKFHSAFLSRHPQGRNFLGCLIVTLTSIAWEARTFFDIPRRVLGFFAAARQLSCFIITQLLLALRLRFFPRYDVEVGQSELQRESQKWAFNNEASLNKPQKLQHDVIFHIYRGKACKGKASSTEKLFKREGLKLHFEKIWELFVFQMKPKNQIVKSKRIL